MRTPDSVSLRRTAIHLGRQLPGGSSDQPEGSADHVIAFLFGLAPAGACRVSLLAQDFHLSQGIVTVALVLALADDPRIINTADGRYPPTCPVVSGSSSQVASRGHPIVPMQLINSKPEYNTNGAGYASAGKNNWLRRLDSNLATSGV